MLCRRCGAKAVLKMERHNTSVCSICLEKYVLDQTARALRAHAMIQPTDRTLVAVSGGKDSLSLWHILLKLGYKTTGLYIDQGIGDYSCVSRRKTEAFAAAHGLELKIHALEAEEGAGVPELAQLTHRPPCSVCGTMKRYNFNKIATDHGFDVVATGHNLDDEAARLLGNLLHWQDDYLTKQGPVLPKTHPQFVRKVKPLVRLAEREITAYAVTQRIDYVLEECPMAGGSKMLVFKDVLNRLEADAPGTKQFFYFGFLARQKPGEMDEADRELRSCQRCGQPTTAEVCGHCRLVEKVNILQ